MSGILESAELRGKKVLGIGISCIGPLVGSGVIILDKLFNASL